MQVQQRFLVGKFVNATLYENPAMRPTIEEVVERFYSIRCSFSTVELPESRHTAEAYTSPSHSTEACY
jgi:hypothetical protein